MSGLSPQAEEILAALAELSAEAAPLEWQVFVGELVKTLTLREVAIVLAWRDGARGMEPEHGALSVTFAGETVSSEFTRKSRGTLQTGKRKK